ncbi:hypothetical protein [Aneurinibacillus tyrosinisolvens]|uniref:hypothetical protein n=1 Tax=Aneurinibacillus tyrosinisolvens TaxID=1443435 RepID=UPI00063F564E|nr:hypothetical protein [Aneurinibacillus tyrosinisolvens]
MKGRCLGEMRVSKISLTFTENFAVKINRLSLACSKSASELLFEIVFGCLNHSDFVEDIQRVYSKGEYQVKTEPGEKCLEYKVEPLMNAPIKTKKSIKKHKLFQLGRRTEKVDVNITIHVERQANILGKALGCSRAQLLAFLIMYQLESPQVLNGFMERYLVNPQLRLLHVKRDDEVFFEYFYAQ